ncbi:MAG: C39 family peptidase [Halanaerobiales bacterium]|nr:C39 family peptidase [Halanaerobiales bacterium]
MMIIAQQIEKFEKTKLFCGQICLQDDEFSGFVLTKPMEVEPYDELVVSWNGITPGTSVFKIEAQISINGQWSNFYPIALWNQFTTGGSFSKEDELAKTLIDLIKVKKPNLADAYRIRAWIRRTDFSQMPRLTGLFASTRNSGEFQLTLSKEIPPVELDVPCRSQMIHHKSCANLICSPTSCGMVLGYYGIYVPTDQMIWKVYDKTIGIFGNWPFNTAALAPYGFEAKVEFIEDLFEALQEIQEGRPIITGIRYKEGELENAAIPKTDGHIITLVGYNDGYVIVNDSAASSNAEVRRRYCVDQFLKVCGGVFYKIRQSEGIKEEKF